MGYDAPHISIDRHRPEVYARIRPGSRPEIVFANLRRAAALANESGLELRANVAFLTPNAAIAGNMLWKRPRECGITASGWRERTYRPGTLARR
jgi:hypothetical protein